jgi:redox-sensitive bicupin YhaK (pirin superfamily)
MISVLNATQRFQEAPPDSFGWATFASGAGLGSLQQMHEYVLPPGGARTWNTKGELLTYVRDGTVTCDTSVSLRSTEMQLVNHGLAPWHVHNVSKLASAHVFQIIFAPSTRIRGPSHTQRRFSVAERRAKWLLVASSDARDGALHLLARARVYSTLLHDGIHVVHELAVGRAAWLHVIDGECTIGGHSRLRAGDAAGFFDERSVSLTSRGDTELLLVEVTVTPSFRWNGSR